MSDCIFCRIAAHEIPSGIVAERDDVIAFRDLNPQAPVHVLVVPKEHIRSAAHLSAAHDGVWLSMLRLAQDVADSEGISEAGYRLVSNVGKGGGQTVDHLHVHVLGGRQMTWPPG